MLPSLLQQPLDMPPSLLVLMPPSELDMPPPSLLDMLLDDMPPSELDIPPPSLLDDDMPPPSEELDMLLEDMPPPPSELLLEEDELPPSPPPLSWAPAGEAEKPSIRAPPRTRAPAKVT